MPSDGLVRRAMAQKQCVGEPERAFCGFGNAEGHPEKCCCEKDREGSVPDPFEGHHDSGGKRNPEPCGGDGDSAGRQLGALDGKSGRWDAAENSAFRRMAAKKLESVKGPKTRKISDKRNG